MAKSPQIWLKEKRIGNFVELFYVETDETGAYVIKETIDQNGTTKEKRRDVILNFPIELLGMKRINGFDAPYGKLVYRINIAGKEYINSLKQIRLLIRKKVGKQPFHSKYGFKFKDYINIALRSQEKKLKIKEKEEMKL